MASVQSSLPMLDTCACRVSMSQWTRAALEYRHSEHHNSHSLTARTSVCLGLGSVQLACSTVRMVHQQAHEPLRLCFAVHGLVMHVSSINIKVIKQLEIWLETMLHVQGTHHSLWTPTLRRWNSHHCRQPQLCKWPAAAARHAAMMLMYCSGWTWPPAACSTPQ